MRAVNPFNQQLVANIQCTGHGVNALALAVGCDVSIRSPKSPAVLQLLRQLELPGTASKAQIRAAYLRRVKERQSQAARGVGRCCIRMSPASLARRTSGSSRRR